MCKQNNSDQSGQGLVEYAIIALLVALIVLFALAALGINLREAYCNIVKIFGVTQCSLGSQIWTPQSWTIVQANNWNTDGPICGGPSEGRIFADDFSGNDYVINIDSAQLSQGNGYGVYFRATGVDRVNGYTFQYDPGYGAFIFRNS
jgi:Flp pilus assembly pilin Flp